MSKGYVILEVGFEYNDEIYHTGNYGETYEAPSKVYTNKDKAEAELVKLTNEKLRGEYIDRYGYGVDEFAKDEDEFIEFWKKEFDPNVDYDFKVPVNATDEQLAKLQELLSFNFYTLVEVDLE